MRTVTFSNRRIVAELKKNWHCVWKNLGGEKAAGSSFAHSRKDPAPSCARGNGEHNVQILFLDSQGRLLNLVAGYLGADDLMKELERSTKLARAIVGKKENAAEVLVRDAHKKAHGDLKQTKDRGGFASFARRGKIRDHKFLTRNPLMPWDDFRTVDLVGNGTSFFGSSNGRRPDERIGEGPGKDRQGGLDRDDLEEMMRDLIERSRSETDKKKKPEKKKQPTSRPSRRV